MKKIIPLLFITLAILFSGCTKEKFTCKITSPKDGARILISKELIVTVDVKDTKSNVTSVTLTFDDSITIHLDTKPYTHTIPAGSLTLDKHTFKAIAINGDGEKAESSITIFVVNDLDNEAESPDFVTFANGQFPTGWSTYTWEIDNTTGHNDKYSLRAANYPVALVFANKTMKKSGFVEFYSYGENIDLYINEVKAQAISSVPDGNWEKRIYPLDTGKYQLKWQAEGVYKYIDDIRFYTSE